MEGFMKEPIIHSHLSDELEEAHPRAYDAVFCDLCNEMLHASNNECMQTWVEWYDLNICFTCFINNIEDLAVLEEDDLSFMLKSKKESNNLK